MKSIFDFYTRDFILNSEYFYLPKELLDLYPTEIPENKKGIWSDNQPKLLDKFERVVCISGAQNVERINKAKARQVKAGDKSNGYLEGIHRDFSHFKNAQLSCKADFHFLESKDSSISTVKSFLKDNLKFPIKKTLIYYSGHGCDDGSGSWTFSDGTFTFQDIKECFPFAGFWSNVCIVSDSCFSGQFCLKAIQYEVAHVAFASSYSKFASYEDNGGKFTNWIMDGKICPIDQCPEAFRHPEGADSGWGITLTVNSEKAWAS